MKTVISAVIFSVLSLMLSSNSAYSAENNQMLGSDLIIEYDLKKSYATNLIVADNEESDRDKEEAKREAEREREEAKREAEREREEYKREKERAKEEYKREKERAKKKYKKDRKKYKKGDRLDDDTYDRGVVIKPVDEDGIIVIKVDDRLIRLIKATKEIVDVLDEF